MEMLRGGKAGLRHRPEKNAAAAAAAPLEPARRRSKIGGARCRQRAVCRHCQTCARPVDAVVQLASCGGFDMRLDLTPYRRSTIGFDRLFDMLESNARAATAENYPPFNLERLAEDRYRITLAVAGFSRDEIEITAQQNLLLVSGKKDEKSTNANFLHVGIANRSFERRFELADFVFVEDARLNDGLLVIDLVREVPEAMKPKTIAIKTGAPLSAVENKTDVAEAA
jgi:molecular chaperone IbpA